MDAVDAKGQAIPFSICFFTLDLERDKGGERIKIDQPIVTKHRQLGISEHSKMPITAPSDKPKDPHHGMNFTRNLVIPGWEHMVKVHMRLITHFNGKRVIW